MLKNKSRGIPIICHCVTDTGMKMRFGSFIRNCSVSKCQEKENYAVIIRSHFPEFNDNAETFTFTVDNGPCVNNKIEAKFTTFLSAF